MITLDFYLGHLVTQQTSESTISLATCSLMGATSGYIGLVIQLPPSLYRLLTSLEKSLAQHIPSVGQIEHSTWRSMRADKQSTISSGFIDGDLIQLYLDLPKVVQTELLKHLPVCISIISVEEWLLIYLPF